MTQEQYSDLQRYIPQSEMVKITFESLVGYEIEDWAKEINVLIEQSLNGDKEALFNLLELTYLNAYNEGELADAAYTKGS